MSRIRATGLVLPLALLLAGSTAADEGLSGVGGKVLGPAEPLSAAKVYAYHLADLSLRKAVTDTTGRFLFGDLPAGLYKIIAHKRGFLPAVVMLTRATADTRQFLELQLAEEVIGDVRAGEDFWSLREQIPADVLREIKLADLGPEIQGYAPRVGSAGSVETDFKALAGVDEIASVGEARVAGGEVGIEGQVGDLQLGLTGNFVRLESRSPEAPGFDISAGYQGALTVDLDNARGTQLNFTSLNNSLTTQQQGVTVPVGFERYQVSLSQQLGENSRSDFRAQYINESRFYGLGSVRPQEVPDASRTWLVEGSYSTSLDDTRTLETGVRYRERQFDFHGLELVDPSSVLAAQRVELFGHSDWRLRPTVLVEYGLYSTLTDGSLSLSPRGGMVFQLSPSWRASTLVSFRVDNDREVPRDFFPVFFDESHSCTQGEEICYKVMFSRQFGDQEELTIGALHRQFGETLRLYFSKNFFDHLESLYLVKGDSLPEIQFAYSRRLTPRILARLESNFGAGGGGILYATDQESYTNEVRYLVTSLDTQFQSTATGVFIAFHHLEQELSPLRADREPVPQLAVDRLQFMLTQDLNLLLDLAANWAVQLNMEVSRGSAFERLSNDEELRKRFLGGIAVRF